MSKIDFVLMKCGFCGLSKNHKIYGEVAEPICDEDEYGLLSPYDSEKYELLQCPSCDKVSLWMTPQGFSLRDDQGYSSLVFPGQANKHTNRMEFANSHAPSQVIQDAQEAEKCYHGYSYNASGCMVRRAMHSILLTMGVKGKDLNEQINSAKEKDLLTEEQACKAHELRTAGKVGAHPEWEEMNIADAEFCLQRLAELITELYSPVPPKDKFAGKTITNKKRRI